MAENYKVLRAFVKIVDNIGGIIVSEFLLFQSLVMGPLPEKILAKKLKKRELKKAKLLKEKHASEVASDATAASEGSDGAEEDDASASAETPVGNVPLIEKPKKKKNKLVAASEPDSEVTEEKAVEVEEGSETTAELAVEKTKKHKMKAGHRDEPPKKKKMKKAAKTADGDTAEDDSVEDMATANKDNVTLPGSSLGLGILSDKSFSSLAPLVSEPSLQVGSLAYTVHTD